MKPITRILTLGLAAALCSSALADDYTFKVVARGLARPTGILAQSGDFIYFTEIPTPGAGGGLNGVKALNLRYWTIAVLWRKCTSFSGKRSWCRRARPEIGTK